MHNAKGRRVKGSGRRVNEDGTRAEGIMDTVEWRRTT